MTEDSDFVKEWQGKIKAARRYREKLSKFKRWDDFRKYYRGDWAEGVIPVNRVFSYGRGLIPQVYFRSPRVSVTATRPELEVHARVVEAVDNWLIQECLLKKTLKRAILTAYHSGTAPIKLGYDSEFGFLPEQAVDQDSGTATQYARKEGRKIEYHVGVKPGMPWALPVMPEDVLVPFGPWDADSLPWVAHRILRPLEDVKQDQKYPRRKTEKLKGSRIFEVGEAQAKRLQLKEGQDDVTYAELWEIRDASTGGIHVICEGEHLLGTLDALQIEGLPWEFLIFNEDPEYFWGIPDVAMIEPQQVELNDTRTQMSRHRKIALLKFLYKKGALDEGASDAFFSSEVGPGVEVDDDSPASAVVTLQPHVPPDLWTEALHQAADIRETVGFGENQGAAFKRGTPPTATETAEVSQSFDARIMERRDIVGDLLVRIIRRFNQFIFKFWTGERVAQIAGPNGTTQWVRYTGEELEGEYTLKIDPDSGVPVSRQLRQTAADSLFKTYNGDRLVDQIRLRQLHLNQFEWVFPGATQLVNLQVEPGLARELAGMRQPTPLGKGVQLPLGNRGGGRRAPITIEEARERRET